MGACGNSIQMLGDCFLARTQDDNDDLYERLDITIEECTPEADWVRLAREARLRNATGGYKGPVVTSAKQLSKFEDELEKWLEKKLKEWDTDEAARKKHEKNHGSRESFEASLREKVKAKL